jgi:hypothetical protein
VREGCWVAYEVSFEARAVGVQSLASLPNPRLDRHYENIQV